MRNAFGPGMTRFVCQGLPLVLLVGCFLDHSPADTDSCIRPGWVCCDLDGTALSPNPDGCPYPCPDFASYVEGSACFVPDAGPPPTRDVGPPDTGPADAGPVLDCPLARAHFTCLESSLVAPDTPFELPIAFDGCTCCGAAQCAASVDRRGRRIDLTTASCPDPCDCDTCNVGPATTCALPGLERGDWSVYVNGSEAFDLRADFDSGLVPPPPACVRYADEDECGADPSFGSPATFDRICVEPSFAFTTAGDPPARIRLERECAPCGVLNGACTVTVEQRLTDDLPFGGEIRIHTTQHSTACDVFCTDECVLDTHTCTVPPLEAGGFYRVWWDGREVHGFLAGSLETTCVDLARAGG